MIDLAGAHELLAQCQLALQDADGTRTQNDLPVIACLGRVLVDAGNPGFRDLQRAAGGIVVVYE